nr:hypothetical protein [uncultured Campylobacter sp.]
MDLGAGICGILRQEILIAGFRFEILCVGLVKFGNLRDFKAQNFSLKFMSQILA